jgi:hypothetical protein
LQSLDQKTGEELRKSELNSTSSLVLVDIRLRQINTNCFKRLGLLGLLIYTIFWNILPFELGLYLV